MKKRLLTGVAIIAVLIIIMFTRQASTYIFDAFFVMLAMVAGLEMSNLLAKRGMYNNKYFVIAYPVVAYLLYVLAIKSEMQAYLIIVLEIALFVILTTVLALYYLIFSKNTANEIATRKLKIKSDKFSVYKAIHSMFAYLYPCFLMLTFVLINNLTNMEYLFTNSINFLSEISLFALILTFLIPVFSDTFAYLTGSLFKGPKLCPKISPNKTISGAIGGLVWGTCSAIVLFLIFNAINEYNIVFTTMNIQVWHLAIVGFIATICSQLGDLFESYIKRLCNAKDSGTILPGHGGIMDRFDSHMFCAPVIFIYLLIIL